jgi:hypothetical protein
MKRDLDLIRSIMLAAETSPPGRSLCPHREAAKHLGDVTIVGEHIRLLQDAGFLEAEVDRDESGRYFSWSIYRITNDGHDYLDSVRDETVWAKTKDNLKKVSGSAALDVVKGVAKAASLSILGL